MLQFDGELYLLATDQGYINQPDLVWEKLNEVKCYKNKYCQFVQGLAAILILAKIGLKCLSFSMTFFVESKGFMSSLAKIMLKLRVLFLLGLYFLMDH